jgi:hypothetical protein
MDLETLRLRIAKIGDAHDDKDLDIASHHITSDELAEEVFTAISTGTCNDPAGCCKLMRAHYNRHCHDIWWYA